MRQSRADPVIVRHPAQGPAVYCGDSLGLMVLDSVGYLHAIHRCANEDGGFGLQHVCHTERLTECGISSGIFFSDKGGCYFLVIIS
jgi:hypothetical protein